MDKKTYHCRASTMTMAATFIWCQWVYGPGPVYVSLKASATVNGPVSMTCGLSGAPAEERLVEPLLYYPH